MTATAKTSEEELETFYGLKVAVLPPNRACIRSDQPDVVFTHKEAKGKALLEEITRVHCTGRPILVGTASVEESEQLAGALGLGGVQCRVLNAKNDEIEAAIVADAGALKAVTISTNMAGRGTDIRLGGKDQETREQVVALGGLYVIGTNRHESRRIDNQLRGRAGRQGDPGSSRFFISLEDDLMVRYRLKELISPGYWPAKQEDPIQNPKVAREIARTQRIVEGQNLEIRKTLRNYSFIVEEQRKIIHRQRRDLLLDKEPLTLLAEQAAQRYKLLPAKVGQEVLNRVEKQITLFHMDRGWTEHLDNIAYIREGIHLWGMGGKIPSFEFQKQAIEAFAEMQQRVIDRIIAAFNQAEITSSGIDAQREGLKRPSATWTYLINDIPFDNPLQGMLLSSSAFAFGASLVILMNLPFVIIGRIIHWFLKRKKGGK
jgi:preprotein translocase subunit SecA